MMIALTNSIAQDLITPASNSMRQDLKMLHGMTIIDAQVGQALFAVFVDDVLLFEQRVDQHHRKKRELQAPQL